MRRARLLAIALLSACGGNGPVSNAAKPPDMPLGAGQSKCHVKESSLKPLIVEWTADQRGELESVFKSGLVVVRLSGCELDVLEQCSVSGSYKYDAYTPKQDHVTIRDEDDLYAKMPVGAASLSATLQQKHQLDVAMTLVGRWHADHVDVSRADLRGRCDGATHVVSGLTAGAFEFSAGGEASAGGGVAVGGAGAGGSSMAKREVLRKDGDQAACASAKTDDPKPPQGCGALLKIEMVPLPAEAAAPTAASAAPRAPGAIGHVVDGTWTDTGGVLVAKNGHYVLDEVASDFVFEADVELVDGSGRVVITVGWRVDGAGGNNVSGYRFGFNFDEHYRVYTDTKGTLAFLSGGGSDKWIGSDALTRHKNQIRIEASGAKYAIYANGRSVLSGEDRTFASGRVQIAVGAKPAATVRFSNIKLTKR